MKKQLFIRNNGKSPLSLIKAEAYEEFADKLKEKIIAEYNEYDEQEYPRARIDDIDNLLKELVGDKQC